MEKKEQARFYITTPIYYVNDTPHIGHAYTTVAADVQARFHRMLGERVFFLTGTDEHGQKVKQAAEQRGLSPQEHADQMVENFQRLWRELLVSNDAFIRTTDPEHQAVVQELLQRLWQRGLIQRRTYKGWYCTPDERFWTEKDLREGACPECGRAVQYIEEDNYFFLMSRFQGPLLEHLRRHPEYIKPSSRLNEVLGFLSRPLGDLCISRPLKRLSWGIPLPFDPQYVTYVWFDALVNYYSALRYLAKDLSFWPADCHVIGKDILTTHAVYWSTMLMALELPLPRLIFAHGWWTVEGRKMSKSLGNVVEPQAVCARYGVDAFRYFLLREIPFGLDGDFSESALVGRINNDLANDLGNLLSRTLGMLRKYCQAVVPERVNSKDREGLEKKVQAFFYTSAGDLPLLENMKLHLKEFKFNEALEHIWAVINGVNKFIDSAQPWRERDEARRGNVLYTALEALRLLALYLAPFMPRKAQEIWDQLGYHKDISRSLFSQEGRWGLLAPGTKAEKGPPLFPRQELPAKAP
jgi:methionyl-tRNA synthetase